MMGSAGPLRLMSGLYGADEVLTDRPEEALGPTSREWVATLITLAPTAAEARRRARDALVQLADEHCLSLTPEPEESRDEAAGLIDSHVSGSVA